MRGMLTVSNEHEKDGVVTVGRDNAGDGFRAAGRGCAAGYSFVRHAHRGVPAGGLFSRKNQAICPGHGIRSMAIIFRVT